MAHLTKFSFEFFSESFTEDASPFFLYHGAKKSKMTKNSNQGGPALNSWSGFSIIQVLVILKSEYYLKVARDSCDVTHTASYRQACTPCSHVHGSKSCTKYSLHLMQSTSRHKNVRMLYAVKCSLYIVGIIILMQDAAESCSSGVKKWQNCLVCQNEPGDMIFFFANSFL